MRYLKILTLILAICVAVLMILFRFYKEGYENYYSFEFGRVNEIINGKTKYDVVFMGSSRTFYHVNPRVVDSVMRMSSYNAGIDGANILETNFVFQTYLKSHPSPKLVVLDIHRSSFAVENRPFWNPTIYYPFIDNKYVFNALKPYQHVYLIKYFPPFRFLEADDLSKENSFLGHLNKRSVNSENTYKGFLKYSNDTISLPFTRMYGTNTYPIEQEGLENFRAIIDTCKAKNIKLVVTFAPVFQPKNDILNPELLPTVQKICDANRISFLVFKDPVWNDHRLFREELHLNNRGADLYSSLLAEKLKMHLN